MLVEILKSKIHRATVTEANLNYIGSITIDEDLMDAAGIIANEKVSTSSDLNVYDAIFYAGDCNAGSKTIAINLPNDERVHAAKGARRLQLKNSMDAKFNKIVIPIGQALIEPEQQQYLNSDAFFWA